MLGPKNFIEAGMVPITGGLMAGTGEVFHLVVNKTTDTYYQFLKKRKTRDSMIFATLSGAYDAMTESQGDTLLVWPGDHVQTESLTWAKSQTRIVGAGSPNQAYQPGTLTTGGVRLSCVTAAVSEILNITGHYVQMHNIGTYNSASSATSYCDVRIAGKNFYGNRLSLRGGNGTTQLATIGAGVPLIVDGTVAGAGNALFIENSILGSSGNSARSKGPGCIEFIGSAAGTFGMHFRNCILSTRIETASNDSVGLVYLSANYAADRELLFDNCGFYNFWENLASSLTYAIRDSCTTTHQIIIHNCWANKGITNWTNAEAYLSCSSPLSYVTGGIGLNS